MKKIKLIIIIFFGVAFLAITAYVSYKITAKHYKEINTAEQKQNIIEKNTIKNKAKIENDNKQAIIDSLQLVENIKFKYIYVDPPEKDDDIAPVDEYIEFIPDLDIDQVIKDFLASDNRRAMTHYKYKDSLNEYAVDFRIDYEYLTQDFRIKPVQVSFEPVKRYPFCLNVFWNITSGGIRVDYDIWRIRLSPAIGLTNEIKPLVGISIGFKI